MAVQAKNTATNAIASSLPKYGLSMLADLSSSYTRNRDDWMRELE
jgi:predicted component of type VI protein secretion system